jgi:methionyl-tRNA formyltransferase
LAKNNDPDGTSSPMKIVFYGARYMGQIILIYLAAEGHEIRVIPEDQDILAVCNYLSLPVVTLDSIKPFDLFVCCHGKRIIPSRYLEDEKFINMHPMLFKYRGRDPIKRYIANGDKWASIESHWMTEEVDAGEVINQQFFETPPVRTYGEFYNLAIPHYLRCIHETMNYVRLS